MKTKILLFLLLLAGSSLKAQSNYISISSPTNICSGMDSPGAGGPIVPSKSYYWQYRFVDLAGSVISGYNWTTISYLSLDAGKNLLPGKIKTYNLDENYKVEIRRHDGSTYSASVYFTVHCAKATPTSTISGSNVCSTGGTGEITIQGNSVSTGVGSVNYSWTVDGRSVTGSGQNLTITKAPGTYVIRRSHSGDCVSTGLSKEKTIVVYGNLVAGQIGNNQSILYNTRPVIFENRSNPSGGEGSYSYQWQKSSNGTSGWTDINGATSATYHAQSLTATTYYRRRDIDKCGSEYTNIIKVEVSAPLGAGGITSTPSTICYNTKPSIINCSIATGGNPSYTYTWQKSSNGSSGWTDISQSNSMNYQPPNLTATTYYRRKVTDNAQASIVTGSIKITVRPAFNGGSINSNETFCSGSTPQRINSTNPTGGTGRYSYTWENSTNNTNWTPISNATSSVYQPGSLTQTHYYRRITEDDECGSSTSNTVIKSVATALNDPGISYAGTLNLCYGTSPVYSIIGGTPSGGIGTLTYQWQQSSNGTTGWVSISGATSKDYKPGALRSNTYFRRIVTSQCESKPSAAIGFIVNSELDAGSISDNQEICFGESFDLLNEIETADGGFGNNSYQWEKSSNGGSDWSPISGSEEKFLTGDILTETTRYRRKYSNSCGSAYSNDVEIVVKEELIGGTVGPAEQTIIFNTQPEVISIVDDVTGGFEEYEFQWQKSIDNQQTWINISGANSIDYLPSNIGETTYFRRIVNDKCGRAYSNVVTVKVKTSENIAGKIGSNQTICNGQMASNINVIEAVSSFAIESKWQKSEDGLNWTILSGEDNDYLSPGVLSVTTYFKRVYLLTSNEEISTNIVKVEVRPKFTGGVLSENQSVCSGNPAQTIGLIEEPIGGFGDIFYQWQKSGNNVSWTDIVGATSNIYEPGIIEQQSYYRLKINNQCGEIFTGSTTLFMVDDLISGDIESSQTIDYNSVPNTLIGEGSGGASGEYSYQWQKKAANDSDWKNIISEGNAKDYSPTNLTITTSFRRKVESGSCEVKYSNVVEIIVHPDVVAGRISGTQMICYNSAPDALTGTNPTGGNESYTYQWQKSSDNFTWEDIEGAVQATYEPGKILENTYFRRTDISGLREVFTNVVKISVTDVVQKPITNEEDFYCRGDNAEIDIYNILYGQYIWYNGNMDSVKTGMKLELENLTETTAYYVEGVDSKGCKSELTTVLLTVENVKADFVSDINQVDLGYPVQFTNLSKNANSYEWNFNDGDLIYEDNAWHYYNVGSLVESLFYDVQLSAYSKSGCVDKKNMIGMIEVLPFNKSNGRVIEFVSGNIVKVASSDKRILEETTRTDGEIFVTNPVEDVMVITSGENISKVLVYSMSGQLVKSSDKKIVNLSSLRTGIYLVVIETESKNYKQVKIQKL